MIISAIENVNRAEIEMVIDVAEKQTVRKSYYNNILRHIRIEVGRCALDIVLKMHLKKFKTLSKIYLQTYINKLVKNIVKEELRF